MNISVNRRDMINLIAFLNLYILWTFQYKNIKNYFFIRYFSNFYIQLKLIIDWIINYNLIINPNTIKLILCYNRINE